MPGPQIRAREGDRLRVVVHDQLPQSTAIHFDGLEVPFDRDVVPFITQPLGKPGKSYTDDFTAPNPGSHMYPSRRNSAKQVRLGSLGAFLIDRKRPRAIAKIDKDYVMILNDGMHGDTLDGRGFPATEPIVMRKQTGRGCASAT